MLRQLEEGKFMVEEVCSADVVQRISEKLNPFSPVGFSIDE